MARADVLLVSLGSTAGLRAADDELAGSLRRAGATVAVARAPLTRRRLRTLALIDLDGALAARRAAAAGIEANRPRAIVYSTTTAALLWPRPGAIRFDAPAAGNRPGRHGIWQRGVERRRLREAPLLLPWSDGGLAEAGVPDREAVVVPVAVEPSGDAGHRDIAAITYAADPHKKGLDHVLDAWARVRHPGEELVVAGLRSGSDAEGVRSVGLLPRDEYRALLRRSRVFVTAPRREDYGVAQLEALADGCALVTTAAPGPYAALPLAREIDPRLVGPDIGAALRMALDAPVADGALRARAAVATFSREAVDAIVADRLLPALLGA